MTLMIRGDIDPDKFKDRLRDRCWNIEEDPTGPTEYYNDETGETIITNPDSDYDLKIAYTPDGEEVTLETLFRTQPDGDAVVEFYYTVTLRSKENPDHLIHEEKMRMKYEYFVEVDGDEEGRHFRTGTWQRTSVEMSFNYDEILAG